MWIEYDVARPLAMNQFAREMGKNDFCEFLSIFLPVIWKTYCKRFAQSVGLGSEKNTLLELFFTLGALFGALFHNREVLGSHFWPIF